MKLIIENLRKKFDNKEVLKGASYTFESGKIYGLLGRNGAGKTTMFQCLTQNLSLDEGNVKIVYPNMEPRNADFEDIGFVFTQPHLPEFMTGYEFIKYFIGINKEKIKEEIDINKAFLSLEFEDGDCHKLIKEYSHGMKNKVQILAFLILKPAVILLDEPLTSFDIVVALQIKNLIKSLKMDHIIIFSTHILELAQDLCDEIVILHNGVLSSLDISKLHDKDFEQQLLTILSDKE